MTPQQKRQVVLVMKIPGHGVNGKTPSISHQMTSNIYQTIATTQLSSMMDAKPTLGSLSALWVENQLTGGEGYARIACGSTTLVVF